MADSFYPPDPMNEAFPMTRPGKFDDEPWNQSSLTYLESQLELDIDFTEHLKNRLKQMQESDADPEQIAMLQYDVQYMLHQLENVAAKIKLEKKKIAEAQKLTTKVPKQQKIVLEA